MNAHRTPSPLAAGGPARAATVPTRPGVKAARRATLGAIVGLALALVSAVPAQAAPGWVLGSIERSSVINCTSLASNAPYNEVGAIANAELLVRRRKLPRVGEVFYVRTRPGAVGRPCADQSVAVEVVLPVGVKLAISPRKPVRCSYFDIDGGTVTPVGPAPGCPQRAGRGVYGAASTALAPRVPRGRCPTGRASRSRSPYAPHAHSRESPRRLQHAVVVRASPPVGPTRPVTTCSSPSTSWTAMTAPGSRPISG